MTDLHYKWTKIIASKHYGGKQAVLTPVEWQELVDDLAKQNNEIAMLKGLVHQQEGYTALLTEELNEVVGMAAQHGWKSERFKKGEEFRERIGKTKESLGL